MRPKGSPGRSCEVLRRSWGAFGALLEGFGSLLGCLGLLLGGIGLLLGGFGVALGGSWVALEWLLRGTVSFQWCIL